MSNSPRAPKLWTLAAGAVVLAGLGYLYISSRTTEPSAQDEANIQTTNKRPGSRGERPQLRPTTRPVTEADIPTSPEEALSRPEVPVNQSMNELRQLFAAGQHAEVITKAEAVLDSAPDRHQVRAFLAMAHCSEGDAEQAQVEVEKLPDNRKFLVMTKCQSVGITLTAGRP